MDTTDGIFEGNGLFQKNTILFYAISGGTWRETKKFCGAGTVTSGKMEQLSAVQNGWT